MEEQGFNVDKKIIYQDNKSTISLDKMAKIVKARLI